jgi:hypothetical protein
MAYIIYIGRRLTDDSTPVYEPCNGTDGDMRVAGARVSEA